MAVYLPWKTVATGPAIRTWPSSRQVDVQRAAVDDDLARGGSGHGGAR